VWQATRVGYGTEKEMILPKGTAEIIFNLADKAFCFRDSEKAASDFYGCSINGLNTAPFNLVKSNVQTFVGIQLQPYALRFLFGIPSTEFTDRLVNGFDVCDSLRVLHEELSLADGFKDRVPLILKWLGQKIKIRSTQLDRSVIFNLHQSPTWSTNPSNRSVRTTTSANGTWPALQRVPGRESRRIHRLPQVPGFTGRAARPSVSLTEVGLRQRVLRPVALHPRVQSLYRPHAQAVPPADERLARAPVLHAKRVRLIQFPRPFPPDLCPVRCRCVPRLPAAHRPVFHLQNLQNHELLLSARDRELPRRKTDLRKSAARAGRRPADRLQRRSPGCGPLMHTHWLQDESLTVVQGRMGYQVAGQPEQFAGVGETVLFERGVPHRFWNADDREVLRCQGWVKPANTLVFFLSSIYAGAEQDRFRPGPSPSTAPT
jgi:mannose-6-phosphate isomerase-like protein (cupin superfamily)